MELKNPNELFLKSLINGDVTSFEETYNKYNKKIFNFSLRYLKNKVDAEEVVQDVFLKLWENCKSLKKDTNLNAWLFMVTFNCIRRKFRNSSIEKKHLQKYSDQNKTKYNEITEVEYLDLLDKASHLISKLPYRQKVVFLLHKENSLSSSEIAEKLGIAKKTVENHLNRARSFLRRTLKKEGLLFFVF